MTQRRAAPGRRAFQRPGLAGPWRGAEAHFIVVSHLDVLRRNPQQLDRVRIKKLKLVWARMSSRIVFHFLLRAV